MGLRSLQNAFFLCTANLSCFVDSVIQRLSNYMTGLFGEADPLPTASLSAEKKSEGKKVSAAATTTIIDCIYYLCVAYASYFTLINARFCWRFDHAFP